MFLTAVLVRELRAQAPPTAAREMDVVGAGRLISDASITVACAVPSRSQMEKCLKFTQGPLVSNLDPIRNFSEGVMQGRPWGGVLPPWVSGPRGRFSLLFHMPFPAGTWAFVTII